MPYTVRAHFRDIVPANLSTRAKYPAFSTNHETDIDKIKHRFYNQERNT